MPEQRNGQVIQSAAEIAAVTGLLLMLAGCGSSNLLSGSALDLFSTSSKASSGSEAEYRAALEHYADDCRWRPRQSEFSNDQYLGGGESEWDRSRHGWEVARAALAGREREEGT